jgi:UDP-N-acetyl-D-galactosamine dehydrogenase
MKKELHLGIIGLGYVGLPLAVEFAKKFPVVAFDKNLTRISELKSGFDHTGEVASDELKKSSAEFSGDAKDLESCNVYIIAVPTPIDSAQKPNLSLLFEATRLVGGMLKPSDLVIYESTVYPGCTEEDCAPILEEASSLKFNKDFFCGYSPERINPGDRAHTLTQVVKLTSGSTPEAAGRVDQIYRAIVTAGTFPVASIRVAEAAKLVENSQRDINIAFVNELAMMFSAMKIDTREVLAAAATKWNFASYSPGLVGGHCVGVNPLYLAHRSRASSFEPELLMSGRKINDGMDAFVASQVVKLMTSKNIDVRAARVLVLGLAFKENCSDVRNSKVIDVIHELEEFGCTVDAYDPLVDSNSVRTEFDFEMTSANCFSRLQDYSAVVIAVAHNQFRELKFPRSEKLVVYDLKGILDRGDSDARL